MDEKLHLDYTITDTNERNELVKKIIDQTPPSNLTPYYLEILANYILFAIDKEERKKQKREKALLTPNRMVTVNKREMSYQGLSDKLENGEDGIHHMITNDKNIIFMPKMKITPADVAAMPELEQIQQAIKALEESFSKATGKARYQLKKQIIELRQDQYIIKNHYHPQLYCTNLTKSFSSIDFGENITINADGTLTSDGLISFIYPKHISALLCHYSQLKESAWSCFQSDAYYLMEDFDQLTDDALKDYPLYYDIMVFKIDGKTNTEIQLLLKQEFGITYTSQYISSLWRNKIPKLIAETAQKQYLEWYYTFKEYGKWKTCSKCGRTQLAHPLFFSRNSTSKDGFYSICRHCRNKKPPRNKRIIDLR